MRISDWSSDVCSSDLAPTRSSSSTACLAGRSRLRSGQLFSPRVGAILPMKTRVHVTLKNGVLDPQGKAIEHALRALGHGGVAGVRQGEGIEFSLAENGRAHVCTPVTTTQIACLILLEKKQHKEILGYHSSI